MTVSVRQYKIHEGNSVQSESDENEEHFYVRDSSYDNVLKGACCNLDFFSPQNSNVKVESCLLGA